MRGASDQGRRFFAHSVAGAPDTGAWELLCIHLAEVSRLAASFAATFAAENWGLLAGLWHDIGKYAERFQDYLLTANGLEAHIEQKSRVDHSTAGAQHAAKSIPVWGRLLAYVIAGHHAGLADATGSAASLADRLVKPIDDYSAAPREKLETDLQLGRPRLNFESDRDVAGFQLAFFTRMLFSCLVDADFLATEQFMSPQRAAARPTDAHSFAAMQSALNQELRRLSDQPTDPSRDVVARCRQQVLAACREAAAAAPGLFSLTVPTGGGKTLSSLAFAIDHALQHGKRRLVYAIPFTSIIEQTARDFRGVFEALGDDIVIEHHSNLDPEDPERQSFHSRLAAENWDAPLVVTTNVQLFESLFAANTSRCRKLHNLVNSVIILDEAQTLPVDRLRPCLAVLEELVRNYGCTVVLCTATQPAVGREDLAIGLANVREIIPNREQLYVDMKRVTVRQLGQLADDELIARLAEHDQFLTIVNTRGHAAKLYQGFAEREGDHDGTYHLSTLMCGEHRADVIKAIRQRLEHQQPCRVISTQLIEAGVDLDFPVVYRAMTGIDSIAQAAGRCNREGRRDSAISSLGR